jgi:PAS domain S-box-containing protein
MTTTHRDMTATAGAPQAAFESGFEPYFLDERSRYQLMLAENAGATLIVDAEGVIRYVSPTARRVLAIGNTDAEGQAILSVIHRQDVLNAMVNLDRIRSTSTQNVSWVSRLRTRNRWEWFKVSATSFRYDRGHHPVAALFLQPLSDL